MISESQRKIMGYTITMTEAPRSAARQVLSGEPVTNETRPTPVFENNTLTFHQSGMRIVIHGDSVDDYVSAYEKLVVLALAQWIPDWIVRQAEVTVPCPSGDWNGSLSELLGILYV